MIQLHAFSVVHETEDHPRQHAVMLVFIYEDHVIINFIETLRLEYFFPTNQIIMCRNVQRKVHQ